MQDLKNELQKLSDDPSLSEAYRNRKLILYLIRTLIAIVIIYFLWDYEWINWVLYFYILINLISLISIFGWNIFLNKCIKKTQQKLNDLMANLDEEE